MPGGPVSWPGTRRNPPPGGAPAARRRAGGTLAAVLGIGLAACSTPHEAIERIAERHAMQRSVVSGRPFSHLTLYRAGAPAEPLHVYIEHDGTPWIDGASVAPDPTPRRPLAARLMALDRAATLYLGRPCHFRVETGPECNPLLWTHRRYSPEVVASMAAALSSELDRRAHRRVLLIGYSGGGTLAVLIAAQLGAERVAGVATIAANLDVGAWARYHGYSALAGSLDPALAPALPPGIPIIHFVGGRDDVVPPDLLTQYRTRHPYARIVVREEFGHVCCWESAWPALLRELPGSGGPAPPTGGRRQ